MDETTIRTFAGLLAAARMQPEPQRLLFVFAVAEPPPGEVGSGRVALTPRVCVDKLATEVVFFEALRTESRASIPHWDILFVAALDGRAGIAPNSDEAAAPLRMMLESIRAGRISNFLTIDHDGELVRLEPG